ncbi:MAG: alpha-amylase family glycosyl hydrolase [Ignavibacteriaceae bacterium]|nr:alpha-amylase family glycosyl hydrolase [Ignavibacteriaceae bacterium]
MKLSTLLFTFLLITQLTFSQQDDSVFVTFYYHPTNTPTNVYLPGEFNGWVINNPISLMSYDANTNTWYKTVKLRVGGPDPLPAPVSVLGAYQYKFHADGVWFSDPLNPRQNPNDNNNSYLFIRNPTTHYLLPNSTPASGVVRTRFPEITAYLFPSVLSEVDTGSIKIIIDGDEYINIGGDYDESAKKLSFAPPDPLGDGEHELILYAESSIGTSSADTTTFTVQANVIQFLTLPAETWKNSWRLQGAVFNETGGFDTTVTSAQIIRFDSTWVVQVTDGRVDTSISLIEGNNKFVLSAEVGGQTESSDTLNIISKVNHIPYAQIEITQNGNSLTISGANSTDPDGQVLTYLWKEDSTNPQLLGINGQTNEEIMVSKPATLGEYYLSLTVEDPDFNLDSTKTFFVVIEDSQNVNVAGYADNPDWLKNGRIYLLFFKAFTPTGTIQSAIANLPYIKAMGFNSIWVLPVTEVPGNIDNQINIGYNTIDFMKVETSYGTDQDYKDFVDAAHQIGLKVIQDITPNHTGRLHPFSQEALLNGDYSQYWNYYQTQFIPHNDNGLGQCVTPQGIYYYCGFSDALLNYDWRDLDARKYMTGVYDYWVKEFGIDGYRFDVYWGVHRKYGESNMGMPVRTSLKHIKPDILLLGEDDGTGVGTEVLYADQNGGLDASYDFALYFNSVRDFNFTSSGVNALHSRLNNSGFYPGENSYFMRFMESQDEDRISYIYNSFEKTMPMATVIFTAPGMPMMMNGQEVGWGKGLGQPGEPDLNVRRRGIIDWNFGGKDLLTPHYQRIAQIRSQFPAFAQHKSDTNGDGQVNSSDESDFDRITTTDGIVYAFLRPWVDSNGITVANFSSSNKTVTMNLTTANLKFTGGFNQGSTYWVNNLYNDTSSQVLGSDLANFSVTLPAYGSAVYTISTTEESVVIPPIPPIVSLDAELASLPEDYNIFQNYPNPFNPTTTIRYSIINPDVVRIKLYDILGREIKILVNELKQAGTYEVQFDASGLASGIYLYRIESGNFVQTKKMILLK